MDLRCVSLGLFQICRSVKGASGVNSHYARYQLGIIMKDEFSIVNRMDVPPQLQSNSSESRFPF